MAEKSRPTRQEVLSGKPDRSSRKSTLMNEKKVPTFVPGANAEGTEIYENWYKADGTHIDDIESYILRYIGNKDKYDTLDIIAATDGLAHGQGKGKHVIRLVTVICFVNKGKGAHVIIRRESKAYDRFIKTGEKLNMEVNKTFELVMYLKGIGINPIVHLDLNPDPAHDSFQVYTAVKGWFESMGFIVEYKPNANVASYGADYFL